MADREIVMCVPADKAIDLCSSPGGFLPIGDGGLEMLAAHAVPMDRTPELESDARWAQLVCYGVVGFKDAAYDPMRYLVYRRTPKGSEDRLHGLNSIGIGGHVNQGDLREAVSLGKQGWGTRLFEAAMRRELREELGTASDGLNLRPVGVIYNPSMGQVESVHAGVVFECFRVGSPFESEDVDNSLEFRGWMTASEITADCFRSDCRVRWEAWSRVLIENYLSDGEIDGQES